MRVRSLRLAMLIAAVTASVSAGSSQGSAPPEFPLDALPAPTMRVAPVSSVNLGSLVVRLASSTLPEVKRAIGVGVQEHDDRIHGGMWLCYSVTRPNGHERIWLLSSV